MDAFIWTVIGSVAGVVGAAAAVLAVIPRVRGRRTINSGDPLPGIPLPGERKNRLSRGESLPAGQSLYSSDGHTRFTLQDDANMVVIVDELGDICDTGTANLGVPKCLKLEDDGWLVLYDIDGNELWKKGPRGFRLNVQDNSHVVLYPASGNAIWATDVFIKAGMLVRWIPPEERARF